MNQTSPVKIWREQKLLRDKVNKLGKILSFTKINVTTPKFNENKPVLVLLVEMENKERLFGELADYTLNTKVEIKQKVVSVIRRIGKSDPEGIVEYGIKFKLI